VLLTCSGAWSWWVENSHRSKFSLEDAVDGDRFEDVAVAVCETHPSRHLDVPTRLL
jgi:hypothetical protein